MKALTIKQPWAWAIACAGKNIENRDWPTRYRGLFLIHAGLSDDRHATLPRGVRVPQESELVRGAVIAVAELTKIVKSSRSKWFRGEHGWILENVRALRKPILCTGRLGLWTPPPSVIRVVNAQLRNAPPN